MQSTVSRKWLSLACEQALLFGQPNRASRERAPSRLRRSLARSRETRFTQPNRRACSQASKLFINHSAYSTKKRSVYYTKGKSTRNRVLKTEILFSILDFGRFWVPKTHLFNNAPQSVAWGHTSFSTKFTHAP